MDSRTTPARRNRRLGPYVLYMAFLVVGCSARNNSLNNDPLLGGGPATKPTSPAAPAPATPAAGQQQSAAPPVPATSAATSTAALASNTIPKLAGAQEMAIGAPTPAAAANKNGWQGTAPVALRQPEPVLNAGIPATPVGLAMQPYLPAGNSPPPSSSFDQLEDQLRNAGVVGQVLSKSGDRNEWRFRCDVANPANASSIRTYEFSAPDYLTAMRSVLDAINADRR